MIRRIFNALFGKSQAHTHNLHTVGDTPPTKNESKASKQIQAIEPSRRVMEEYKEAHKVMTLDKNNTMTNKFPEDSLDIYLSRCCFNAIANPTDGSLKQVIKHDVQNLTFEEFNHLDQQFRSAVSAKLHWQERSYLKRELKERSSEDLLLCGLMWPCGYTREHAINSIETRHDLLILKALLLRLNDWTYTVYQAAFRRVQVLLESSEHTELIELIPYFTRLIQCDRHCSLDDLKQLAFIILNKVPTTLICKSLADTSLTTSHRRAIAELLWIAELNNEEVLYALLICTDPFIRFKTLREIVPSLPIEEQEKLVLKLPTMKWVPARIERLKILQSIGASSLKKELLLTLTDSSAAPRQFARFYLKQEHYPISDHYLKILNSPTSKTSANALKGLAEHAPESAIPFIQQWINSTDPIKLATSFYLIEHLSSPDDYDTLILNSLLSGSSRVSRAAFYAAKKLKDKEIFQSLLWDTKSPVLSKIYAAKLLLMGDRWLAMDTALTMLEHDTQRIRFIATLHISQFRRNLYMAWSTPSADLAKSIMSKLDSKTSQLDPADIKELKFMIKNYINA